MNQAETAAFKSQISTGKAISRAFENALPKQWVNIMSQERLSQLRKEAVELVKKGGLSAKIGLTFLRQHRKA